MLCVLPIARTYVRVVRNAQLSKNGSEFALVTLSSDCTLHDSAAKLSRKLQRTDSSVSEPSASSTAWSDPVVSESQAACTTLRDISSSLLSIC